MPTINPLLYSDKSEDEVLSMPGAQAVAPPKVGAMAGFGEAVAVTAKNTAAAVWDTGREAVERAIMGQAYDPIKDKAPAFDWVQPHKMEKIDPLTTGTAAQILAPLAVDIPLTVLSLGAGAGAAAARERATTYQDLVEQGVDPKTARLTSNEKFAETAGTFAITRIPFAKALGKIASPVLRFGAKAGVGAGVMTGIDFLGGETRGAILEAHGYKQQADQMRHWDTMRFASDVLGGSLLGVTTRAHVDEPTQLSARWWQQADSLQHESAPGIPTTPEAAGATADATTKAMNDIIAGNPVDVADVPALYDAHYLAKVDNDIAETKGYIAEHEKTIANYDKQIGQAEKSIEKARAKGHDDIVEYWEQELPRLQAIKQSSERIIDQHREDLARLENPEYKSPAQQMAEPHLTAHAEDMAAITAKAEEFKTPPADTTPAAMADKGQAVKRDVTAEAKEMLQNYRNPVQEAAAATGEPKAAPAPKLTPEQQELVNMHAELRQLADATGDTELHAELDEAMAAHQAAHAEAAKFNVAALCAIG